MTKLSQKKSVAISIYDFRANRWTGSMTMSSGFLGHRISQKDGPDHTNPDCFAKQPIDPLAKSTAVRPPLSGFVLKKSLAL